jgi:hypothetical protein
MDDDITNEEGAFFRYVILSWLEFAFKVHVNQMARTHYQIKDEMLLVGLLPAATGLPCQPIPVPMCTDEEANMDEIEAKKLLRNTVPFINPNADFCEGAYSMVLLQYHTHVFRVAQAVYEFMSKTARPWQCRSCLHLFVVAMQAAGMVGVNATDLREGPNAAASFWIVIVCGESTLPLRERWLRPRILSDLPRDLNRFPIDKEERVTRRRATNSDSPFIYIPLARQTQPSSALLVSSSDDELGSPS